MDTSRRARHALPISPFRAQLRKAGRKLGRLLRWLALTVAALVVQAYLPPEVVGAVLEQLGLL